MRQSTQLLRQEGKIQAIVFSDLEHYRLEMPANALHYSLWALKYMVSNFAHSDQQPSGRM